MKKVTSIMGLNSDGTAPRPMPKNVEIIAELLQPAARESLQRGVRPSPQNPPPDYSLPQERAAKEIRKQEARWHSRGIIPKS